MELASDQQKKMFFAVAHKLGMDGEEAKNRAKKKYNLSTFKDITKQQLTEVIDILITRVNKKIDEKIIASGFEITTCKHCNKTIVVEPSTEWPTCNEITCVRKVLDEEVLT